MDRGQSPASYRDAPAPSWPDHRGRAVPDAVYPVRPDPMIGDVLTAWSNQTTHGPRPLPPKQRRLIAVGLVLVAALLGFFGGMGVLVLLDALDLRVEPALVYVGVGLVSLAALVLIARPRPSVSYIGTEGVHEHLAIGIRTKDSAMRFRDAAVLFVSERDESGTGGAYQGTTYALSFRDDADRVLLEIGGLRHDQGMWAHESEHWVFASAVIDRWSALRWERARAEKEKDGLASFRAGKRTLRVGDRRLCLDDEELGPDVLDHVALADGVLSIHRRGAKEGLFRSQGIDRFPVGELGDLDVLLRALRTWARVEVRS